MGSGVGVIVGAGVTVGTGVDVTVTATFPVAVADGVTCAGERRVCPRVNHPNNINPAPSNNAPHPKCRRILRRWLIVSFFCKRYNARATRVTPSRPTT
jgi:hypothetical protein